MNLPPLCWTESKAVLVRNLSGGILLVTLRLKYNIHHARRLNLCWRGYRSTSATVPPERPEMECFVQLAPVLSGVHMHVVKWQSYSRMGSTILHTCIYWIMKCIMIWPVLICYKFLNVQLGKYVPQFYQSRGYEILAGFFWPVYFGQTLEHVVSLFF